MCWHRTFYDGLDYRVNHGMNNILSILGLPGTGKSLSGLYLAKIISMMAKVEFPDDSSNVCFTYQEFLNAISRTKTKEVIIQDEQRVLHSGLGARSTAEEIQDIERIIRKRQNSLIYIAPTLEGHLHQGILEPLGINYEYGVCRLMFYDNKEIPRGKIYTMKPNDALLEAYSVRKNAFIEKMVGREMGDQYEHLQRIIENLVSDDQFQNLSNKPKRLWYIAKKYPTFPTKIHELLADLAKR